MRLRESLLRLLPIIPLYFVTMVLVHEAGHAVAASCLMPGDVRIYVWPGYELYPDPGRRFSEAWPEKTPAFTYVTYVRPDPLSAPWTYTPGIPPYAVWNGDTPAAMPRDVNVVKLMGAAATLLFSVAALCLLALLKPQGFVLWLLAAGALLHLDMLTGTVFPVLFGARHLYFWGGEAPEAVDALAGLGVPENIAVTAVILLSLGLCGWLCWLLRARPRALQLA
jgi:hypothetical protein